MPGGLGRGFWSLGCAKGTGEKPVEPGMCQGAWRVTSGARDVLQNETSKGVAAGVWEVLGRLENHTNHVWVLQEKTKAGKEKGSGCFQAV